MGVERLEGSPRAGADARQARAPAQRPKRDKLVMCGAVEKPLLLAA